MERNFFINHISTSSNLSKTGGGFSPATHAARAVLLILFCTLLTGCSLAKATTIAIPTSTQTTPTSVNEQSSSPSATTTIVEITSTAAQVETSDVVATSILYKNNAYGFSFTLPNTWAGYTVIAEAWEGRSLEESTSGQVTETGPKLLIRHPEWTKENPREDIPLMIFTLPQWDKVQQEKISLGAAPVKPTELDRNTTFVFALPARYNFDFLTGFREIEQILQENPLTAFNLE